MSDDPQALVLNWVFGGSAGIPSSIINLSEGNNERVCYLAAHSAVIFDKRLRRQTFLQGHCNSITCIAATIDRALLITADTGPESLLVLWDAHTGEPLKSIPQPHKNGTAAMDASPDGKWLATIGAADPVTHEQEIALWSMAAITSQGPEPVTPAVSSTIPSGDVQICVRFNMNAPCELLSNGRRRVYFWSWNLPGSSRFKYYSPPLRSKDFKQSVGDFVASVFVPGSSQALTGTGDGDLVVWDEQGITAQMGTSATDRRAIKLMRIHSAPITCMCTIGDYIVTGGQEGYVRFFDPLLRIVAWFEDMNAGPVKCVGFSATLPDRLARVDAADTLNRFMVPDFVVSTQHNKLVSVQSAVFEEFDAEKRRGTPLLDSMVEDIVDVTTHPTRAEFAVLGSSGVLQRWDMQSHMCIASRRLDQLTGASVCYSRDGSFLVVGTGTGFIYILDTEQLGDLYTAKSTTAGITRVAACASGLHVAVADELQQVLLYAHVPFKSTMRWEYVGKAKAHHGNVVGLCFGETPSGQTRLFSLGSEGRVVDYDLEASSPGSGVIIRGYTDLSHGSNPSALTFAPPLPYYKQFAAETHLLMSDSTYKLSVYSPDAGGHQAVFQGPTFGGPISRLVTFRSTTSDGNFLAYATDQRVVGLIAWPLVGDPAQCMGLIAHPGDIRGLAISYDGRKLLTAGADGTLNMWDIATSVLETASAASGRAPNRWQRILADDTLLEELQEYFHYAQIKAQGEDSILPRQITGRVPAAMVPDLMRAAGYYPSEADISNLQRHIRFLASSRDLDDLPDVSFEDLLYLFINHRPLLSVTQADISGAFQALGASSATGKISRDQLLGLLQEAGEGMSMEELQAALQILTGAETIKKAIPSHVDAKHFAAVVLGFEADA